MTSSILKSRLVATVMSCVALILSFSMGLAQAQELCSVTPYTYGVAKVDHPELKFAIDTLEKYAIAAWYTDRLSSADRATLISNMLSQCSEDTRLSIVVYGLPNKDCAGGFSSSGSVTSTSEYQAFLKDLTDAVGTRKVLYVVEPDAVGLLAQDGSCGAAAGYLGNLKVAVEALSANPNAELYLDVGYWMLAYQSNVAKVVPVIRDISNSGRVKGITINTSNYRSNDEVAGYCTTFQNAMGSTDMKCIVDTSRNFNGSPTTDWCNVATAGIGNPPTSDTGYSNLDYFMWIKVPGESDGYCSTGPVIGPAAGAFFLEGFRWLWDQGYFVKELGIPTIEEGIANPVTEAPVTDGPGTIIVATETPVTTEPATVIVDTEAPTTITPSSTSPATEPPIIVLPGTVTPTTGSAAGNPTPVHTPCKWRKRLRAL
ncbi:hypothetical protein PHYBOEH_009361 [Phytophthora boehmeriae]|uniref:Glycoside hydrolase n=1 Tax=Phytophthora boehmeriae TaxID=109152 RepID=A0A8T1VTH4_9STRA|nr:hypothetical protein PHYBOEH_009361 [Phytophthora boehmeriae]